MIDEKITGITKIAVKGFKSIADECEIEIRPLTILAGANSSGKSSIMQPLLMLKQTLEAPYDPGPLLINGPNVQYTEIIQFLSTLSNKGKTDSFQIGIEINNTNISEYFKIIFKKELSEIEIVEMFIETALNDEPPEFSINSNLYPGMPIEKIQFIINQHKIPTNFDVVNRSRCFLRLESQNGDRNFNFTSDLEHGIFKSIHLPGIRSNPIRYNPLSNTGNQYPGTFENYAASVIHEWQETLNVGLTNVIKALHTLGLTGQVRTIKIGDIGIDVQVGRLPNSSNGSDMVSIADVGLGVPQVLPVIVALIAADPGQLVYIEQPELHLHPRAQVGLANILADAAKRGVQVVAETHSSRLLLGIQTLVAEGELSPELVKLHWFSRNEEGITQVDSVDLDEEGTFGEWSVDFDDVDLNAESRYLDAVDRIRFGEEETE